MHVLSSVIPPLLLLLLGSASLSSCTTYDVCPSGCSHSTIASAIAAAADGDTVYLAAAIYNNEPAVQLSKSITISSGTGGATVVGPNERWLQVNENITLTFTGSFTFKRAAIYLQRSASVTAMATITFTDCPFYYNTLELFVSAAWLQSVGPLSITCTAPAPRVAVWLWTNSRLITDTPMTVTLAVDSSWSGYALRLGGRLEQNAPLAVTISGAAASGNAVYHFPGPWIQRGATTINVSGQATGVYHILGDWSQQAPVNITLSDNATGVRLWGANMVWMQQSSTTITSAAGSHNTTGVSLELSALGSWQQSAEVTIRAARGVLVNQIGWYLPPQRYVRWNQTAVARLYVDELAVVDAVGVKLNYSDWHAFEKTEIYTTNPDQAVVCRNSSYVRLADAARVEVHTGADVIVQNPCPSPSPSSSSTPSTSPTPSPSGLPASPSGSPTPTVTPTPSSTQSPTHSPTSSPSNSPTPSATPTASQTPSGTPSVTPTRSPTSSPTSSATPTSSPTASVTPTQSPAASPSGSVTPSLTPSGTPTRSPTSSPTSSVTPTSSPTQSPTASVTASVTPTRSPMPSMTPSRSPTRSPTASPSRSPSASPSPSPWVPPCQPALLGGGFSAFVLGSAAPALPNAAAAMDLANGATGRALAVRGGVRLRSFNINHGQPQACDDEGYGVVVEGCGVVDVSNSRLSCGGLLASTSANIVSLPSFVGSAGLTVGYVQDLSGIRFAVAEAKLTTASQRLCNDMCSGTVQVTTCGAITLTGTANQLNQTFRVQASDLAAATSMHIVGISATLKLQTVVINVVGASAEQVVSLSNFFVDLGSVPVQTVVWNICGTSDVVISRFQFPGVLLAPRSKVTLENSQVHGQVIAKTLQGGSFQITPSCA